MGSATISNSGSNCAFWSTPTCWCYDLFLARRISNKVDELLQRLMNQRYKLKRSIILASNRVVQQ